ncbi:MAG: hypothetical protein K8R58_06680, partial [Bacteroidales bacterium]|nr:hypothetical protein [Bacteroidales bacterium]
MRKFTKLCLLLAIFIIAGNWSYAQQVTVTVGTGTDDSGTYGTAITPFGTYYEDGQNQMLFTAAELNAAGIGVGNITEIGWEVISAGGVMNGFNIEMKHTSATTATLFESGFDNAYSLAYTPVAGWNLITLTTPFNWDGTSNLLVKVCFDNTTWASNSTVYYTAGVYSSMNAWAYNDGTSGCSDPYEGTTNRPNTRITGETFTGGAAPGVPTNPNPYNGQTGVATSGTLTWDWGSDSDTYDLWYGVAGSMALVVPNGTVSGASGSYNYSASGSTTYEWQLIVHNSNKATTNGPVWNFTTVCGSYSLPYTQDFSTGVLPACWQNIDNLAGGVWQFNDPCTRTINTTTSANGFAIFDSDCYGSDGQAEDADLISPVFDCTSETIVILQFEHYFQSGYGGAAEVFYSIDNGTNWTSLGAWSASSTSNAQAEYYDISTQAAGQSQVLFRWNWQGDWSWFWAVDDVLVTNVAATFPGLWTGNLGNDWQTGGNWDDGNVPDGTINVTIPTGLTNYPVVDEAGDACLGMTINAGGTVTIGTGGDLTVGADLLCNGT